MIERPNSLTSKRTLRLTATASALVATAGLIAGCSNQKQGPTTSEIRAAGAQEAISYGEATYESDIFNKQLKAGKVTLNVLRGKITDKPTVSGTAREYGTINDPILLVPGPDTKDGSAQNDAELDGGFIGVQSQDASGLPVIEITPFDKETMHFTPTMLGPEFSTNVDNATVEVQSLSGSLRGKFLVETSSREIDGTAILPGYAPEQH